eukprot:TRINITY_DN11021_c0_g1_i1.p3 TRINITY_DN11021_c0_g1~~TRINITY_DN11021_c0_g1_i1.p3  ORF type:complete len:428 (-),score=-14.45 TRINITY_DN11021_c0_g1_i1:2493-3776(-)
MKSTTLKTTFSVTKSFINKFGLKKNYTLNLHTNNNVKPQPKVTTKQREVENVNLVQNLQATETLRSKTQSNFFKVQFKNSFKKPKTENRDFLTQKLQKTSGSKLVSSVESDTYKKNLFQKLSAKKDKFCCVSVTKTKTNTHINISNLFGKVQTLWTMSAGQVKGISGRRSLKKTRYAQQMMYNGAREKLHGLGFRYFVLQLLGTLKASRYIIRALLPKKKRFMQRNKRGKMQLRVKAGLKLILVKSLSHIPHNGCRPPGVRRVQVAKYFQNQIKQKTFSIFNMSKSLWKHPQINHVIEQQFVNQLKSHKKVNAHSPINLFNREAVISPLAIDKHVCIHNGRRFVPLHIKTAVIGYKFGAFALTRKRLNYKQKKTSKKPGKKTKQKQCSPKIDRFKKFFKCLFQKLKDLKTYFKNFRFLKQILESFSF